MQSQNHSAARGALVRALSVLGFVTVAASCSNDAATTTALAPDAISEQRQTSSQTAAITVTPGSASGSIGQAAQFSAVAVDRNGRPLTKLFRWTSTDSTIVTISPTGYATAIGVGPAALVATADNISGQAQVTGTGIAIAALAVTPAQLNVITGTKSPVVVALLDANGAALSRRVLWQSNMPSVATVDTLGVVNAVNVGTAVITATSAGKSATSNVTVANPAPVVAPVASVSVGPSTITGTVGQSAQFTAILKDLAGNVLTGRTIVWSSSNTAVVSVSAGGMGTAVGVGSATLIATSETKTGTASVVVTGTVTPPVTTPPVVTPPVVTPPVTTPPPVTGAEPMYVAGTGTLILQDKFDNLASDAAMLSGYVTLNTIGLHADNAAGLGGSGAMRTDWIAQGNGPCTDDSHLIERGMPSTQEIYVQYSVRYTPGFIFDWNYSGQTPCSGNAKKLFFLWSGTGSRFDFISENHTLGMGSDADHPLYSQNAGPVVSDAMWGDGNWHRVTMHVKQSSTPTATDGFIYGWIDGVLRWSVPNWASNSSGGWVDFKMPTTFNQGSPVNQSEWLDNLTIWHP